MQCTKGQTFQLSWEEVWDTNDGHICSIGTRRLLIRQNQTIPPPLEGGEKLVVWTKIGVISIQLFIASSTIPFSSLSVVQNFQKNEIEHFGMHSF